MGVAQVIGSYPGDVIGRSPMQVKLFIRFLLEFLSCGTFPGVGYPPFPEIGKSGRSIQKVKPIESGG